MFDLVSILLLAIAVVLATATPVAAHGIAGNRYFPGTLTFDDPAVADELFIPLYSRLEHPTPQGGNATDDDFSITFLRLLTQTLAIGGDTTWTDRQRDGFSARQGLSSTHLLVKSLLYENDPHEMLSVSLIAGIGGLGSKGLDSGGP
jgi:hypothetical protein